MTPPVVFAFSDPARRTWLALNRGGDAYHVVTPAGPDDFIVRDGLRRAGELTCSCDGGRFRGTCYVAKAAEALEAAPATGGRDNAENWFDGPPGEIAEAWGK